MNMLQAGTDPHRPRLAALAYRAWILIPLMLVCAGAAVGVAALKGDSYTAEVLSAVSSGADAGDPGDATDAQRLAATYAGVLESDDQVLATVSRRTGRSLSKTRKSVDVVNDTETALLRVRYTDTDPAVANTGAQALVQAVSGRPVTDNVAAGAVREVGFTKRARSATDGSLFGPTAAVGAILGLLLGLAVLYFWERADWRVDRAHELSGAVGAPALLLDGTSEEANRGLVRRWVHAFGQPALVAALVPVGPGGYEAALRVQRWLTFKAEDQSHVRIIVVEAGDQDMTSGALATVADLFVPVVAKGTRVRHLRTVTAALAQISVHAGWALLVAKERSGDQAQEAAARDDDLVLDAT